MIQEFNLIKEENQTQFYRKIEEINEIIEENDYPCRRKTTIDTLIIVKKNTTLPAKKIFKHIIKFKKNLLIENNEEKLILGLEQLQQKGNDYHLQLVQFIYLFQLVNYRNQLLALNQKNSGLIPLILIGKTKHLISLIPQIKTITFPKNIEKTTENLDEQATTWEHFLEKLDAWKKEPSD